MKIFKFILVIGLILVLVIPAIINWLHPQPNNEEQYKQWARERDSIKELNVVLKYQFDSIQVLANKKDSIIVHSKQKTVYLTAKKDEKYRDISNYSANQLYLFMSGIKTPTITPR